MPYQNNWLFNKLVGSNYTSPYKRAHRYKGTAGYGNAGSSYANSTRRGASGPFVPARSNLRMRTAYAKRSRTRKHYSSRSRGNFKRYRSISAKTIQDKIAPSNYWTFSVAERITCTAATATTPGIAYFCPSSRNVGSVASGYTSAGGSYPISHLLEMAYNINNIAGTLNDRFVVKKYHHRHTLLNNSNGIAQLTLYKLITRDDISNSAPFHPIGYINASLIEYGGVVNSIGDNEKTPYDYPKLTACFKIASAKKFILEPGQTKVLTMRSRGRRQFNMAKYVAPVDQGSTYRTVPFTCGFPRNSVCYLFKLEGQLADTAASAGNITFTAPSVSCYTEYYYDYKVCSPTKGVDIHAGTVGLSAAGAGPHLVVPLTGADAVELED